MIKKLLRRFLINVISLWLVDQFYGGLKFNLGWQTMFWAALALEFGDFLIRPILNLLLLPINLITLGFFRWGVNVFLIYLVTLFVPSMEISAYYFPGGRFFNFYLPPANLSVIWSFIVVSLSIGFLVSIFSWLLE